MEKDLNRHLAKENVQVTLKFSKSLGIRNCTLKLEWNIITHTLEWPKLKSIKHQLFGKDMEQQILLNYPPTIELLGFYQNKWKYKSKDLYKNVHSFIYNCLKWKQHKYLSTSEWTNQFWSVCIMKIYSAIKMNWLSVQKHRRIYHYAELPIAISY